MGTMIPLGDASRRPVDIPVVTILIILTNACVFALELMGGETFVTNWSAIPAQIVSGHHWITIITAMFLHGSWSHIIGNMIFFWAFGPEIEDAMGPRRYSVFYLVGGVVAIHPGRTIDWVLAPHATFQCRFGGTGAVGRRGLPGAHKAASSLGRQRLVSSKSHGESHNERGGVTSYRWFQELHFIGIDPECIG